jgi:Ca-activated chloride channel family protein
MLLPQFTYPWCLLLALLVPLLLWYWLRRRQAGVRHPSAMRLVDLPRGRSRLALWTGATLRGVGLLALVIALSGPRWPDLKTRIRTEGVALAMVLDTSGSMAERDFDWFGEPVSRLDAVKRVFRLFVAGGAGPNGVAFEGRPTDLIGLIGFGTRPDSLCPLTLSHSVLLQTLDDEPVRTVPGESETNVSDAVTLALHRLKSAASGRKVIVLLSDGEHNVVSPSSTWTPRQAAQIAASLSVPIYTIDAGGANYSNENRPAGDTAVQREAGIRTLRELSYISRGRYFQAQNTAQLLTVCQEIDRLERAPIESWQYRRFHEGYPWFGLGSLVCFLFALGLEMTLWRRLP